MNVLVINAGSSSLKYQFMNPDTGEVFAKGNAERIGIDGSFIGHVEGDGEKQTLEVALPDHKTALTYIFDFITTLDKPIDGIGHRIVQGGWYFPESVCVTDGTLDQVREVAPLAPLHNLAEADVVETCQELYPDIQNVLVFDTSFHFHMPERAWRYAIPRDVAEKLHVRKYGAHGTSHRFIAREATAFTKGKSKKIVSCHLGSGASLCAIQDGKSQETTMGLTPLDGLIMGTRTGTLDPATVFYLVREGHYTIDEIDTMFNKKSGLAALSEISSDSRDIEEAAEKGDKFSQLAIEMFSYRAAQLICEMAQAMEGFDTLVFSAGIGENSSLIRAEICKKLRWLGVEIDEEKNNERSGEIRSIRGPHSQKEILVIPTNEELMIALDVQKLLG